MSYIPLLTEASFKKLPESIYKASLVGTKEDERDLLVLSILGVLSGCLPNWGFYNGDKVYPNLFVVIIAPPGSGKGLMRYAKRIADKYHGHLKERTQGKKRVIIPGNSSAAAIYDALKASDGTGLIIESEIDTLSGALKQDWGGFSDVLRKAFHHESASLSRKGDPKLIDIPYPRFALIVAGTPHQVHPLVESVENGLFSRLAFLVLPFSAKWKDVSPSGQKISEVAIDSAVARLVEALVFNNDHPFEMQLTKAQWNKFNNHFSEMLDRHVRVKPELAASVKRLGLIAFKICIILTSVRRFEEKSIGQSMECSEDDFGTAIELADSLLRNAEAVLSMLNSTKRKALYGPVQKLLECLPNEFTWLHAVEIGESIGIKKRTVGKYLNVLVSKEAICRPPGAQGRYSKIAK